MLLPVAKILTTHGIKGELRVTPLISNSDLLLEIKKFYLNKDKKNTLEVESIRKGPGFNIFLLKFKDIDFEKAQLLKNQKLYIDLKELPEPEADEFYYYQIIDFEIRDKSNKYWGKVKSIMPVGEYELLLIKDKNNQEFYIPLVEEYVEEIDFRERIILVKDNIKDLVESQRV